MLFTFKLRGKTHQAGCVILFISSASGDEESRRLRDIKRHANRRADAPVRCGYGMGSTTIAAEFLGSDGPSRARMCRRLADEAQELADGAINPETRETYLDLKKQWLVLAEEIEHWDLP